MAGGVAEGAKSGTSVLGEEDKVWQRPQDTVLRWQPLASLGYRKAKDTLSRCGMLLGEERDRCQLFFAYFYTHSPQCPGLPRPFPQPFLLNLN